MAMSEKVKKIKVYPLQFAPTVHKAVLLYQELTKCKCFIDMLMKLSS